MNHGIWDISLGMSLENIEQVHGKRGITRKQFLDEHNNPSRYRPELPSSNRSHVCEDLTDLYLGP